jgi:ribosomal protein L29
MKFTEREMTVAVDVVGKTLYAAKRPPWKRGSIDADWDSLKPIEKYHHRAAAGEMILGPLVALPERPTVGATPQFTDEELEDATAESAANLMNHRTPEAWDRLSDKQRSKLVRATVAFVRIGINAMPIRQDPDALTVPDHL